MSAEVDKLLAKRQKHAGLEVLGMDATGDHLAGAGYSSFYVKQRNRDDDHGQIVRSLKYMIGEVSRVLVPVFEPDYKMNQYTGFIRVECNSQEHRDDVQDCVYRAHNDLEVDICDRGRP